MIDGTTASLETEKPAGRPALDAEYTAPKLDKEGSSTEAGTSNELNGSQVQSVMLLKRLVTIAGLSLAVVGLACTTREILGCIALPINGFLFLFNTNSHEALHFLVAGSKYMIMVGVFLLAVAWAAFPPNPTRKRWTFRARKFKSWQTIRFKTHAIVLGVIFIHIVLVKTEILIIPSVCPSSGAELALKGVFGTSAFFFAIIFFLTIFFGRFLCSWLCVYAPVQEQAANFLMNSGNNPNKKKRSVLLQKLISISLAVVFWGALVMATVDNLGKITFDLTAGTFDACDQWLYTAGILTMFPLTVLLIHLLGSRYFCRYLCPIGAMMSLLGKLSLLRIGIDSSKCDDCGACDIRCQMNVDIKKYRDKNLPAVIDGDCIICGDCIDACPKDCMSFRLIPTVGFSSRSAARSSH
jgi:NAD-dependent dihydropyrimidine dehydrogenase PreA subunit